MANSFKEKLIQLADEVARDIYKLTLAFPRGEAFVLGDQLRRALISIPANIIEGYARGGEKEKKRFFNIAYASLAESKYLFYFAFKQGYIDEKTYVNFSSKLESLSKLLWSLLVKMKTAGQQDS